MDNTISHSAGISYFKLTVSGPGKDLHSGVFGGTVYEPMTDLTYLMGKLVKPDGTLLVPGIYDNVAALTGRYELVNYDNVHIVHSDH